MKCKYIDRPKHVYPCSNCNQDCTEPKGNIPTTCDDCRYKFKKENGHNGCKRGLRPCKDFESW